MCLFDWSINWTLFSRPEDNPPLTPDRPQVKRPPPSLQFTSNFLVFYGLSHGTTFEKNGVAQNLIYSKNR